MHAGRLLGAHNSCVSLLEACAAAEAVIGRARALFGTGEAVDVPDASGDLTGATRSLSAARARSADLSGTGTRSYQAMADGSVPPLAAAASSDARLAGHIRAAGAVTQAGAARLDQIAATTKAITNVAPMAKSPASQRMILTALRSQVSQAVEVVQSSQKQATALANEVRGLRYPKDAPAFPLDRDVPKEPYDTGSEIPVGKDPKEVKKWWDSLQRDKKDQLLRDWPDKLGNLDGVPVVERSKANTTIMQRDIDRPDQVAAARGVTKEEVLAHPELYGMAGPMMDRYNNGLKAKEALTRTAERTGAPTFLQVYDPEAFKGDGRAAIAIGDPDHAANTAVVVPGTGNSVRSGWLGDDDAVELYKEANAADRNHGTAVVAWMGYDAPDSPIDPRIGTTALAHQGGQLLSSDVNALNVTHEGPGHMTVLGHSYGSTTVADAAAGYGMHTDDVVLVGCPGTDMAHSAADFHLNKGGHLYVGSASSDPITQLGAIPQVPVPGTGWTVSLGDDPAMDGYGSTRFKAEVPGLTSPLGDHSQYYTPGGESLFSMSDIVSGHGDALERDRMTAPHRIPELSEFPVLSDPETYRPGTSGHKHNPR